MQSSLAAWGAIAMLAALGACSRTAPVDRPVAAVTGENALAASAPAGSSPDRVDSGIAWIHASNDADIDAAFVLARSRTKPVFVYWGAKWCPPCNQVKATLFNRQDFIERSRMFVPVYIDGDSPGAQRLGARFKVSGYPTMVLFSPQGAELTRLPGEVEPERYTRVLTLGMNSHRPIRDVLARALGQANPAAPGQALGPDDWALLAFYAWDTDEQQLVPRDRVAAILRRLADGCPATQTDSATRLRLQALAASDGKSPPGPGDTTPSAVQVLLADPSRARAYMDVLTNNAAEIVRSLSAPGSLQRTELLAAFDMALKRFEADPSLSRADRLSALIAQVDLVQIDRRPAATGAADATRRRMVALEPTLIADIRAQASRADREVTDGYERQAVITTAAYLLEQAGLDADSDALLKANLGRSHSPYYLMSELASNARRRGDKREALRWYEEAFGQSEGPATRLQWGASYIKALVELAPGEETRIEKASAQLLSEAATSADAFYERSGRSLQRVGVALQGWNKTGAHAATMKRLQAQLDGVCGGIDSKDLARASCAALFRPAPRHSA